MINRTDHQVLHAKLLNYVLYDGRVQSGRSDCAVLDATQVSLRELGTMKHVEVSCRRSVDCCDTFTFNQLEHLSK